MPVVGFLHNASPGQWTPFVDAFRMGLRDGGYIDGQNVGMEFRWAEGHDERMPAMAADLVSRQVTVIVTNTGGALAAKPLTMTIPIVFLVGSDPVKLGLVASLNRPGGNLTGINYFSQELEAKRLGLLHELVPRAAAVAVLVNPTRPDTLEQLRIVQESAGKLGLRIHVAYASTEREIDTRFAGFAQQQVGALVVTADPVLFARKDQIIALAARYAIPAIYAGREAAAAAGGLMTYGPSQQDAYRQAGVQTTKLLKGAKPADLPVLQPTKFELVVNLKTTKALGLTVPPNLLAVADEVIE
jgi:putative ABC transport system substrate-binding protein